MSGFRLLPWIMLAVVLVWSPSTLSILAWQTRQSIWHDTEVRSHRAGDLVIREIAASPSSQRPGLILVWAVFRNQTLLVSDVRQYGPSNEIYLKHVPKDASAAINGGFFGYSTKGKYMPLGLVISNSQRKNPLIRWTSGGILARDANNRVRLIPIRQFRIAPPPVAALQSKPLLVENGVVAIRGEDSRFNRSAVGITAEGEIVFAGAFESFGRALTLKEFATFLVDLKKIDNLQIDFALAMDGGPGAHLYFPPLNRHYGDPGVNYVPNFAMLKP